MKPTGSVKLIDRKTRVVALFGPPPPGGGRPELLYEVYGANPRRIGVCISTDGRRAKFLVDSRRRGDEFLDLLIKYPNAQARPARSYGVRGWLIESRGSIESPGSIEPAQQRRLPKTVDEKVEIEYSNHHGRILTVEGRPVRR